MNNIVTIHSGKSPTTQNDAIKIIVESTMDIATAQEAIITAQNAIIKANAKAKNAMDLLIDGGLLPAGFADKNEADNIGASVVNRYIDTVKAMQAELYGVQHEGWKNLKDLVVIDKSISVVNIAHTAIAVLFVAWWLL